MDNFIKKLLIRKIQKTVFFVITTFIVMGFVSVSIISTTLADEGHWSDPQEKLIKQVLRATGAEFGLDPGTHCVYASYHDATFCIKIIGPELMAGGTKKEWAVRYGLELPDVDKRGYNSGKTIIRIYAWTTKNGAKADIIRRIKLWGPNSKDEFHKKLAIRIGKELDMWQADRFLFTTPFINPAPGVSKMDLTEALYRNSVKYGLISGDGGVVPVKDSDRDEVPDTIDQCPNTKAGIAVDADGCPVKMKLSLGTDKNTYSPGETVLISSSVWDAKGGLEGAAVVVAIDGTKLTTTAHSTQNYAGKYECKYSLPAGTVFGKHTVTATASYSGYPGKISKSINFTVGKTKIEIEIEKIIPVPGKVPVTITVLDQNGNPLKGIVKISIVDKNNKEIHFVELEKTTGYTLDDKGLCSTTLKTWNPGERKLKWSMGYTYLKDVPLSATIKVEIRDKEGKIIGEKEEIVPFNLAMIHGVVVDKSLKPINQNIEPKLKGISPIMVFKQENGEKGNFWVMVKPYNFQTKKSIKDLMDKGWDVTLNWDKLNPLPLTYSIEKAPKAGEVLELGKVGKTPLEKIKAWYNEFGRSPHTWPDGTTESKPLVGKYDNGNVNNFMGKSGACPECLRYGCIALQYKTLSFLNNLKKKKAADDNVKFQSKLKGWNYMPVYTIELPLYPQHNAVVLWDRAALSWKEEGIILDPHAPQTPDWYSVKAVFGNTILLSWNPQPTAPHQESYGAVYPMVKGSKNRKYNLKYFDDNIRPPWLQPHRTIILGDPQPLLGIMNEYDYPTVAVSCPVDMLIFNSKKQRLGILPNGDTIAEFEPIDLYFWVDEKGDKQWFFALPQDTYEIELIGTGSGNFHLLAYTPGKVVHDYGENPITAGEKATLTIDPAKGDKLTLANGKKVTPTSVSPTQPQNITNKDRQLYSSADAYVYAYNYRNWNRSNRGGYDQLRAGWHPTGGESRAYIKFDLSNIDPAHVNKAVLKLYHFQTAGGSGVDLGIYRVTGPWKEGTDTYHSGHAEKTAAQGELSWVQQPSIDTQPIITFNPGRGLGDWTDVDITPLVKEWLAGTPNYGLVIKPTSHRQESVYHFASRERDPGLDKPKGKSKAPMLILSENSNMNNVSIQPPQPTKSTFSCANKDNEEKGCCCFKGAHTYRFNSRYVTNVLARFDTGRRFNCRSTVNLDVDRGNGWETIKTVQANSSREGSEVAPTDVLVPVNGAIEGFRISDGCVCCIDSSEITLNADYPGGGLPQPSIFQNALGKPCASEKEFIRSLYQSILERDLDVSLTPGHGAAHLLGLQNGALRWKVIWNFFNSPEYKNKQKNHQDFIRDAYQAVLGREPQAKEIKYWPQVDRNDILRKFFNSDEYIKLMAKCPQARQTNSIASIAGQWNLNQDNGYTGTMTLQQDQSGRLSGTAIWNGYLKGTIDGRISGNAIEFTISYPGGVIGLYKGALTQNGTRIVNGTTKGNNGVSANWEASKAESFSISGQWIADQSNGYNGTLNLQQDQSGRLTGNAIWNGYLKGTIDGKISGNTIEFTIAYPGNVKGLYKGTLTQNGTKIVNGTVKGNNGVTATWDASR